MSCCFPGCYPYSCCYSCCAPACCYPCYYPCCYPCYPCYKKAVEGTPIDVAKIKIYDTLEETARRSKLRRQCRLYRQVCEACRLFVPVCSWTSFFDTETVDGVKDVNDEDDYYKTAHFHSINFLYNVCLDELNDKENFPPHFLKKYYDPPYPFYLGRTDISYDVYA